ncbi:MAG TPA: HEAT repeat domain-containing protein [Ktedonobacterales bacterium]
MLHSRHRRAAQTYRATLLAFSALTILLTLFTVAIIEQDAVAQTIRAALQDVTTLRDDETRVAAELTLIPFAIGALTYLLAAQGIQLLRLSIYLRRFHQAADERLQRTAPLYRLSHLERGGNLPHAAPIDMRGRSLGKPVTLASVLSEAPHVLLLGATATGKTTALLGVAYEASRARELLPLFLGRRPLPLLISLPLYAEAAYGAYDKPNQDFLAEQIAAYSSPGFASRLPSYLGRKRVLLICDDLDEAPEVELGRVVSHLTQMGARRYRRVRVLATANITTRDLISRQIGDPKSWRICELEPLQAENLGGLVTIAPRYGAKGAAEFSTSLRTHLLDEPHRLPVTLTALKQIPDGVALPHGIAQTLAILCRTRCEAVASEDVPASYLLQFLGGLASALCAAGTHTLPLDPATEMGPSVGAWLEYHHPQAPVAYRQTGGIGLSSEQIETLCATAVNAGLLLISPDGATLRFTHRLIEATCAALWLIDHDEQEGPLDPSLLGEQWTIPLLFWAGLSNQPERVANGVLRLRETSRSVALRARLGEFAAVQPAACALSLATIVYGSAVYLATNDEEPSSSSRAVTHIEARLRAILDEALAVASDPAMTEDIVDAARNVGRRCGPDLDVAMRVLAHTSSLGRLTQAELYTCLGLFASPTAIDLLIERLGEREPTIRAGVTRGLILAGYAALARLQAQIASADEGIRDRATEIIDAIAASDAAEDTSVHRKAVHVLATGAPEQRAAAAQTLGALQSHPATQPLIARLRDREPEVRIAAVRALGKLGAEEALEPLRAALRHGSSELRIAIVETLGAYQPSEVAPDLARLLDDPAPTVRAAAATALGAIPDEVAIIALKAHSDDPDPTTQAIILSALRRLGQR